ncbi:hypothetical protein HO173_003160 [Letharia columbiana]|uniref:Uncharacterized protein n=1 Tax=Letharia columbiana TaxID=112416 RepID=A0A8H6G183_9LECA|nr:uncharacterized protein HO173_003160 [Letharia columbiana]KAF6238654.1 hypothetical protein HO173_003160 [Letharia columbiana]
MDTVSLKSGNNPSNSSASTTEVPLGAHSGIEESDTPLAPASRAGSKASKGADAGCRPKKKAKFEAPSFKPPPYGKNFAATQARRDIYKEVSERVVAIAEHEDPFIGEDKMKIVWTECAEE